ncbi:MAG: hypothetical protein HZA31_12720 [Opitutae bacterium]|nr:hypothetical protein [Opitutae bacterium]
MADNTQSPLFSIVVDGNGVVKLIVEGGITTWQLTPSSPERPEAQKQTFNIYPIDPATAAANAAAAGKGPPIRVVTTQGPCEWPPCDIETDIN